MMKRNCGKRIAALSLVLACSLSVWGGVCTADVDEIAPVSDAGEQSDFSARMKENRYNAYFDRSKEVAFATEELEISAGSAEIGNGNNAPQRLNEYKGENNILLFSKEELTADFTFFVPKDGKYYMVLGYHPVLSDDVPIEIGISIDGKNPFYESAAIILPRIWKNEADIQQDERGNEYAPRQVEVLEWTEEYLSNPNKDFDEPLLFCFTAGEHQLRLTSVRESFALKEIRLVGESEIPTYEEYIAEHGEITDGTAVITVEAEAATLKSSQVLRPVSDRTSPMTTPYDTSKIRMNTIGGENWKTVGQWIEWTVPVEKAGYYRPCMRYEQSFLEGIRVKRKLTVDGTVPYQGLENIPFDYSYSWNMYTLGGDAPQYIYLSEGVHTLRLEVVLDDFCEIIRICNDVVYDLNSILRRIHMVVGSESDSQRDKYRDYQLEKQIPDLISSLQDTVTVLETIENQLNAISRSVASQASCVRTLRNQLENMIAKPETIPYRLDTLSSNVGSLSAWASGIKDQPLLLDKLYFVQPGAKMPAYKASFIQQTVHEIKAFFSSFVEDYNIMGEQQGENVISLWIGIGREQAQILNSMIKDLYTPKSGVSVNVKLVNASVTEALLSGQAPDIMIMMGRTQPVDLAVRGVLLDLKRFSDFDTVSRDFMETALVPYEFNKGCYGLPDSESFMMQFYRKDIFAELGIECPTTWNEFFDVISVIQKNGMDVGAGVIGSAASLQAGTIYSAMLYQNGGSFFNEDQTATALRSEAALTAFSKWTDLYKKYSLPETYDFYNRFRKGEMPLAIASYTEFARMYEAAPEIRDMWDMVPIPGTVDGDGNLHIEQAGSGTAAGILASTAHPDLSWNFLKWWTGKEAQERYSKDVEGQMGILARYATANPESFASLGWTRIQYNNLMTQWRSVVDTPEIPGSYYLWRGLDNALKEVAYDGANQREALTLWDDQINNELERKRKEFGIYYAQ